MSSRFRHRHRIRDEFGISLSPLHRGDRGAGGFGGPRWSGNLYAHRPGYEEFLEEWYDRSAEACDRFENMSEVDKYCVTCTVCRHFSEERCLLDSEGSTIINLLDACHAQDE